MISSRLYSVMDDYITEALRPYLAIGYGADGKERISEIKIKYN